MKPSRTQSIALTTLVAALLGLFTACQALPRTRDSTHIQATHMPSPSTHGAGHNHTAYNCRDTLCGLDLELKPGNSTALIQFGVGSKYHVRQSGHTMTVSAALLGYYPDLSVNAQPWIYGQFLIDGRPAAGSQMQASWSVGGAYDGSCRASTDGSGIARCVLAQDTVYLNLIAHVTFRRLGATYRATASQHAVSVQDD